MRVADIGASEGRSVMERIGPPTRSYPPRKGADFRWVFLDENARRTSFTEETQMNAIPQTACASSGKALQWSRMNWPYAQRNVRKLQARIVKATKEGCCGKVKALQWLLTHSRSGKVLAVKRVTENQGNRTPGVNGEIWSTPAAKTRAVLSLSRRGYRPQPLRRVYIPKGNGTLRPLGIPTMTDRAMQALYLLALDPVSETTADKHSYGFRKRRSTQDALAQCFLVLCRPARSPQWVFEADIKGCFDNISHDWVLEHIPMDTPVLRKWLKAGMADRARWFPTEIGDPARRDRLTHVGEHGVGWIGGQTCPSLSSTKGKGSVSKGQADPLCRRFCDHRWDERNTGTGQGRGCRVSCRTRALACS